jgi:hypothetical protein
MKKTCLIGFFPTLPSAETATMASTFPLSLSFYSLYNRYSFSQRDFRDGWPLLTVETEVNGDLNSTNERDPSLVGFVGLFMPVQEICSALAALLGPVQNIFFLTLHYFDFYVLIAQQAGQATMLGRLPLSMCLWLLAWTSGGERGVAGVDPNHTTTKKRGILPYICSMTRNNKSCLFCVSLKLIPPAAAPSFLVKKNQRIINFCNASFCYISHKMYIFSHMHINKGRIAPLTSVTVMTHLSSAKRRKHNSFSFRHLVL